MYSIIEKHYLHNHKQFIKYATYKLNIKEEAEDAVQEAYCRALKYIHTFQEGMHFGHWFSRILSNTIKDAISDKYGRANLEELDEQQIEGKEEKFLEKRMLEHISLEINSMQNEEHREILELYFSYGFTPQEIKELSPASKRVIRRVLDAFKRSLRTRE